VFALLLVKKMKFGENKESKKNLCYSNIEDAYQDYLAGKITYDEYKSVKDIDNKRKKLKKRRTEDVNPFHNGKFAFL
jgi:hypothetical protein